MEPRIWGQGGFSILLYLCNQREDKFLWLFLRMVCSQDLEHLFQQQPLASSLGLLEHNPSGLEKQCQAVLKALLALLCPIPPAGQLAPLPPCPPTVQLRALSLPAWCPSAPCSQASLCPVVAPPRGAAPL